MASITGSQSAAVMVRTILTAELQATLTAYAAAEGVTAPELGSVLDNRAAPADLANSLQVTAVAERDAVDYQFIGIGAPRRVEGQLVVTCLVGRADQSELDTYRRIWAEAVVHTIHEHWMRPTYNADAVLTGLSARVEDEAASERFRADVAGLLERSTNLQSMVDPIRVFVQYTQRVAQARQVS